MPFLSVANFNPPGMRSVAHRARFWSGEVQALDENDVAVATQPIIGLAGFAKLSFSMAAPSNYDTAEHPVLWLVAELPMGILVTTVLVPDRPVHVSPLSRVSSGSAAYASIDLTDAAMVMPAGLYHLRAQYNGMQDATRLGAIPFVIIARP